jgi:hypothetical protein
MAHQEEWPHALLDDIERETTQRRGKLVDEWAAVEARLANLHQRESALEVGQATAIDYAERQLATFTRASQNVAEAATLLDTFLAPSTDGAGKVYQRRNNILGIDTT